MERVLRWRRALKDAKSRYLTPSRDINTSPSAAYDSDGTPWKTSSGARDFTLHYTTIT